MNFNLTIDKKVQAAVDTSLCTNCGKCRELCPTGAMKEHQKTVYCAFAECGEGKGEASPVHYFSEAKDYSIKTACSTGCPLKIAPQAVAACIKSGDVEEAYELISEKNPLPWVCSQVCGNFCRDMCKRGGLIDESLDMSALERYILSRVEPKAYKYIGKAQEKIAVIGGGPAGITAAFDLSKIGYRVTIFEKDEALGGAMRWGIPSFRLDKERLAEEIERIISPGIDVRYNCNIGEDITIDEIWDEGFGACLIAVGSSYGIETDIPGAHGPMAYNAVDIMRNIDSRGNDIEEHDIGEKIVVIGGSGLAVDAARILVKKGKQIIFTAEESAGSLQISPEEFAAAADEGIEFRTSIAPKQIIREGSIVKAVEFMRTEYIEDERGILKLHPIKGSEFNMFCDTVVFAEGLRSSVEDIIKVETYPDSKVKIDQYHRTNKNMIFACGDVTGESGSVVEAMAAGRQAAVEIDNAMQHRRMPKVEHHIANAPDEETIYPDNIQMIRPPKPTGLHTAGVDAEPVDDITPMLRSAGIGEELPKLVEKKEDMPKVAIAGGGIAGITAAIALAKKGYRPMIFEKYAELGGSYRWFASDKRIDKQQLRHELAKVEASGIEVVYNATVGVRPSLEELSRLGYEVVLFAIGESAGKKPDIANAGSMGVFESLALMSKLADEEYIANIGKNIVIVGSDELAFDIARKVKEPSREVTLMASCSRGRLQVTTSAVNTAVSEGINITTGVQLSRINAESNRVRSADFKILENKLSMNIPCDTLILGGTAVPDIETICIGNSDLEIDERGYMIIDDKLSTTIRGVFAIGDFNMSSPDAGRAGAAAVDNYLSDGGLSIDVEFNAPKDIAVTHEIIKGDLKKDEAAVADATFKATIDTTGKAAGAIFTDEQASLEAARCMQCGYHKENAEKCMGCGICAKSCPVGAVRLVSAEVRESAEWPNVKDIEDFIGGEQIFSEEVE